MDDRRHRLAALCALFAVLGVLLVAHGALEPDPDRHDYPNEDHLVADYDAHVGSGVVFGGWIVSTDPAAVRISDGLGEETTLTLTGLEGSEPGDRVWLYGTASPDRTVAVETAVVREAWEIRYMYAVSALGGLLVLGRFVDGWRLDRRRLAFEPRAVPLRARLLARLRAANERERRSRDDETGARTEGE